MPNRIEMLGLFGIGTLLIAIAVLLDPIGASPDTGVLDLGSTGTRCLLGFLGLVFVAGGVYVYSRGKKDGSKTTD